MTHIDIAGPVKLLINKGSIVTKNQQHTSAYILVCICSLTKHASLFIMGSTDTTSASLALSSLMSKVGQPNLIIADSQSSFTKIMRENSLVTQNENIIEINSIPIQLVPVGNMGHKSAGSVEKKIDLLRRLIGDFDFTKTSLSIQNFNNLLDIAVGCINRTPIGSRRACKPVQAISTSPVVKFISPETLFNPRCKPLPTTFISITKDINNYMETSQKMIRFISDLMATYIIEIQNYGIKNNDDFTCLQEGDTVAFKTRDFLHHNYHHPYNMGLIKNILPSVIDDKIRTVKVSYIARPGEKVMLNGSLQTLTKGLQCTTTRPVNTLIKLCGKNEMEESFELDALRTEKWLNIQQQNTSNKQVQQEYQKDNNHIDNAHWRPSHIISTRIPTNCIAYLTEIQQTLIDTNQRNSQFRVIPSAMHITHLVMKNSEQLQTMFQETNNEITNKQFQFQLGKIVNLNGNICIQLISNELSTMQQRYQDKCKKYNIEYDEQQSYHITLLKKNYKLNIEPIMDAETTPNIKESFSINTIDLCSIKKSDENRDNYFDIIVEHKLDNNEIPKQTLAHKYNTRQSAKNIGTIVLLTLFFAIKETSANQTKQEDNIHIFNDPWNTNIIPIIILLLTTMMFCLNTYWPSKNCKIKMGKCKKAKNSNRSHTQIPNIINEKITFRRIKPSRLFYYLLILSLPNVIQTAKYPYLTVPNKLMSYMDPVIKVTISKLRLESNIEQLIDTYDIERIRRISLLEKSQTTKWNDHPEIDRLILETEQPLKSLPKTINDFSMATRFIIETNKEAMSVMRDVIRNHTIHITQEVMKAMKSVGTIKSRNRRNVIHTHENLLEKWNSDIPHTPYFDIPDTEIDTSSDEVQNNPIIQRMISNHDKKHYLSEKDIQDWTDRIEQQILQPNHQTSTDDNTHPKSIPVEIKPSKPLDGSQTKKILKVIEFEKKTRITTSSLCDDKSIKLCKHITMNLQAIKYSNLISLPDDTILINIARTKHYTIFQDNLAEAYFVWNEKIVIGKGSNKGVIWSIQNCDTTGNHHSQDDESCYLWIEYTTNTNVINSLSAPKQSKMQEEMTRTIIGTNLRNTKITNMIYYTQSFKDSSTTLKK